MKILIDTHIFLGAINADRRLTPAQRAIYEDGSSELHLSAAGIWEILIKCGTGKLVLPKPAAAFVHKHLDRNRIAVLPLRTPHFAELEKLPPIHRDPFDRILVAQARAESMPILTGDPKFANYEVELL